MLRDVTRDPVRAIVRLALAESRGNCRIVPQVFNRPAGDRKRFLSILKGRRSLRSAERNYGTRTTSTARRFRRRVSSRPFSNFGRSSP